MSTQVDVQYIGVSHTNSIFLSTTFPFINRGVPHCAHDIRGDVLNAPAYS